MKIGLVIYGSLETVSGGYHYDRRLVSCLREAGHEVRIFSLPWRNYAAHLSDNLRFRLPAGLDLLIQDELNHPSLLAANRRPHPCPVVSLVHHLRSSERSPAWQNALYRRVERLYLNSVDGFIFNSETTRRAVTALAGDGAPGLVALPPTDRFGPPPTEAFVERRAARAGPLRLLFLGNVIPRKGLYTLLEALRRLPPETATLEVVGSLAADPAYARRMQRRAARLALPAPVRFHGSLDEAALAGMLGQADLLVVPSTYEGFGIVYLEGMGFGLPAVATTAGGAGEIVTHGVDGFLVPPGDGRALAGVLERLAGDRRLLARLSLAARRRYLAQPAWETTCARMRAFLETFPGA